MLLRAVLATPFLSSRVDTLIVVSVLTLNAKELSVAWRSLQVMAAREEGMGEPDVGNI